ncbi:hypothetical protein [Bartonella tamiae]|uniref:Uncharacterized protein n=1 Tax=Bartonella tamiae Th239 TaxID=1094558 RepID=J0ZP59_9HYPH|nr:hypothetical protein [Bartonella tamiae]EJF90363.1 hypothetical protein ME5_00764 [Bartonella tamiae Th239]EJF93696.1 hypothetical protein MEG_01120 [Bartonella tamiae Th307]
MVFGISGIFAAARAETLNVTWCRDENTGYVVEFDSTVKLIDLKKWFESRGFKPKIFFPDVEVHEFKDPHHPRYAPKLAAVVGAWEAIKEADLNKTVKQTLVKWLNLNAAKYELLGEDGLPRANIIQELAGIANWEPSGGAPKTRSKEIAEDKNTEIMSEMDIKNVFDDDSEIPF